VCNGLRSGSVEGISQPWHSLAPSLGAESQGSWISWQQVYSRVDSRSMEVRSTRITFEYAYPMKILASDDGSVASSTGADRGSPMGE